MIDALTFDLAALGRFLKDIYASEHFNRNLIQGAFLFLVIYILFKYLINPLWKLHFYRKQGFSAEFVPFKNSFKVKTHSALKRYNDALYDFKQPSQQKQKQRAITFNFIATPAVVLLDPSLNQDFASYQHCYDVKDMVGDFARIFTKGLSNAKGNEWKKQRKIISFSFHSEFIKDNLSLMQQCLIESLNKLAQQNLESIQVIKTMENIVGETIGRVFFGENIQEYSIKGQTVTAHLLSTLEKVEKICQSKPYMLFGSSLIKRRIFKSHKVLLDDLRILENACRRLLVERKNAHEDQKDLAWRLLGSQANKTEESRLSDEIIIANYADLVIAGAGPTAYLIGMALYELSRHPEMMIKLAEEIKGIYNQQSAISIDSLNKMNWLTAILKETQRMYNPKMLGAGFKRALNDHKIGNIKIKKGTLVSACFATSCFDPEYFEDPFDFKPQRWIERPIKNESYLFTPFGIGQRNCIGQQFAMITAKIVLSEFVNRFNFKVREGYVPKLELRKLYGFEDGLPMDLINRKE